MSELCKSGEHDDCHLYWCSCSCHGQHQVYKIVNQMDKRIEKLEPEERTQ